jgi:nucleoside-diphosphate-sugar epimerase
MILVTGGTGLVGSHLLFALAKQQQPIRAIKRSHSDLTIVKRIFAQEPELFNKIEWFDADILDTELLATAFENITQVYHNAAMVSFDANKAEQMLQVNIEGTANVVNLCIDNGVHKLVFTSSVAAMGKNLTDEPISEETHWYATKDNSNYAISKYGAEREVWRGIAEGLNAVIVNPSVILGDGSWDSNSGALIKYVYNQKPFYPTGVTGFVDVRDVVACMILLMQSDITAERFIINSENIAYKTLMDWAAEAMQRKKPFIKVTALLNFLGWRFEKVLSLITGRSPLITKETTASSVKKQYYLNDKIIAATGHRFIPIKESVAWTCKMFLEGRK